MNPYAPVQPRIAFGFAATIMAAITMSLLVVLPSKMEPESREFAMLTAASSMATNRCATISLKCAEWTAGRGLVSAPVQVLDADPKCKEPS
jgi:hypothetical protein